MSEVVLLAVLVVIAMALVIVSIVYRINEVREEAAVWDALIARVRDRRV